MVCDTLCYAAVATGGFRTCQPVVQTVQLFLPEQSGIIDHDITNPRTSPLGYVLDAHWPVHPHLMGRQRNTLSPHDPNPKSGSIPH